MCRSWHLALGKRLKERRVRGVGEVCERSIHYTPSAISCPPCLPSVVLWSTPLFQSIYCRTREYGTRSFIIARVTNRFFPATDIGRISKLLHLRRRRVSLIMFLLRLQVVPLDIYEHVYRDKYQIKRAYESQTSWK